MSSLSVLVECSACAWGKMATEHGESAMTDIIRSVVSFSNSYLSMSVSNRLLLFGFANGIEKRLLFNSTRSSSSDASAMMVAALRGALRSSAESNDRMTASPLAAVLAHAICHMKRVDGPAVAENASNASGAEASTSSTNQNSNGRAVVVSMTSDFGSEHSLLMNLFFSAAKHCICVDIVSLGEPSPLLQQAADITGGAFVQVHSPRNLLKEMMVNVLADTTARSIFPRPTLQEVDYRASCACHHQLVSSGWVCSVCLSVLCKFIPICSACGAVFKVNRPRKIAKPKRKT